MYAIKRRVTTFTSLDLVLYAHSRDFFFCCGLVDCLSGLYNNQRDLSIHSCIRSSWTLASNKSSHIKMAEEKDKQTSGNVREALSNFHISSENSNNNQNLQIPEGITNQEREAAEVLLQMGMGTGTPHIRKSVIIDTRSALKANASISTTPKTSTSEVNLKNAFVPIHAPSTVQSSRHVYIPQATKSPVPPKQFTNIEPQIPISFVQRQDVISGRPKSSKMTPNIPPAQDLSIYCIPLSPSLTPKLENSGSINSNNVNLVPAPADVINWGTVAKFERLLMSDAVAPRLLEQSSEKKSREQHSHRNEEPRTQTIIQPQHTQFAVGSSSGGGFIPIFQGGPRNTSSFASASSTNLFVPRLGGLGLPPGATLVHLNLTPPQTPKSVIGSTLPGPGRRELSPLNSNSILMPPLLSEPAKKRMTKAEKQAIRASVPLVKDATKPIEVDGFLIPREYWAKAFVQSDICHAAGILFKALFSPEEIQKCTLRGRNGTSLLNLQKRSAIFRVVGWMKHKNQNPYSFNTHTTPYNPNQLSHEEKMMIEKKVFVERRYQTSRKIRDCPYKRPNKKIQPTATATVPPLLPPDTESQVVEQIVVKPEPVSEYDQQQGASNNSDQINMNLVQIKNEPIEEEHDVMDEQNLQEDERPSSPKQPKLELDSKI